MKNIGYHPLWIQTLAFHNKLMYLSSHTMFRKMIHLVSANIVSSIHRLVSLIPISVKCVWSLIMLSFNNLMINDKLIKTMK
jgi:hypothetical protein